MFLHQIRYVVRNDEAQTHHEGLQTLLSSRRLSVAAAETEMRREMGDALWPGDIVSVLSVYSGPNKNEREDES